MHVCIRPWTATDAPAIVEALSDAGVTDNLRDGLPKPYTEADARDYIAYARTAGEGAYAFAIDAGGEYAEPFADNAASCRVLEKAGFRLEGVMRHSAVKNGVVRDMRLYSLLREDLECIGS